MSWQATSWALREAPVGSDCVARLILVSLGDYARPDGTGAFPSVATLMSLCGKSEITVRRKLAWMERIGVIRRGDQSAVAAFPANRRPVVWDLAMGAPRIPVDDRRDETGVLRCQNDTPEQGSQENDVMTPVSRGVKMIPQGSGVSKNTVRGITHDTSRGVAGDTQTISKYNKINNPLKPPAGGVVEMKSKPDDPSSVSDVSAPGFDSLRGMWPKKSGNPVTLRRLWDAAARKAGPGTVLSSARAYLAQNRGLEDRYVKGLKSWLSDPVCYAAVPAGGSEPVSPMAAGRRWLDEHEKDFGHADGPDVSVYDVACWVRSHPEVPAGRVPAELSARFLGGESE